jgi:hypothetical protein
MTHKSLAPRSGCPSQLQERSPVRGRKSGTTSTASPSARMATASAGMATPCLLPACICTGLWAYLCSMLCALCSVLYVLSLYVLPRSAVGAKNPVFVFVFALGVCVCFLSARTLVQCGRKKARPGLFSEITREATDNRPLSAPMETWKSDGLEELGSIVSFSRTSSSLLGIS